ncbi:hypothetical protein Tco_0653040 [Tanacetum coccineum]|uniref:Uncharacterized protein n=1 Tax=Tanacetum coccineum TaxID=301880 RepID=A0ABQ4WZ70_9ASTR
MDGAQGARGRKEWEDGKWEEGRVGRRGGQWKLEGRREDGAREGRGRWKGGLFGKKRGGEAFWDSMEDGGGVGGRRMLENLWEAGGEGRMGWTRDGGACWSGEILEGWKGGGGRGLGRGEGETEGGVGGRRVFRGGGLLEEWSRRDVGEEGCWRIGRSWWMDWRMGEEGRKGGWRGGCGRMGRGKGERRQGDGWEKGSEAWREGRDRKGGRPGMDWQRSGGGGIGRGRVRGKWGIGGMELKGRGKKKKKWRGRGKSRWREDWSVRSGRQEVWYGGTVVGGEECGYGNWNWK